MEDDTAWCPVEVDENGIYHGQNYQWYHPWGFCSDNCPRAKLTEEPDNVKWNEDETLKMTLTYNNTALFSGLELYGILLAGILILGLMIVLVPAMGKTTVQ